MDIDMVEAEYVPLAEQLVRIATKTPDRFKREPVLRESNHNKWAQRRKATNPKSPKFATDQRAKRLQDARQHSKNGSKAKTERKAPVGAPNLRTARRAAWHNDVEPETFDTNFKARPAPSSTRGVSRSQSRSSSILSQATKQEPFSFDKRVTKKKVVAVPEPVAKFHHPAGALPASFDKPSGVPVKQPKTATRAQPFKFATNTRNQSKTAFSFCSNAGTLPFPLDPIKKSSDKFMKAALKGQAMVKPESKKSTVPKTVKIETNFMTHPNLYFSLNLHYDHAANPGVYLTMTPAKSKMS